MSRRKAKHEEHENLERWLVSYADFITLLFAFFVVMYSISSVNEGKYRVLSDSLVAAFRNPPKNINPISLDSSAKSSMVEEGTQGKPNLISIPNSSAHAGSPMQAIANQIKDALHPLIDQNLIKVSSNKLWVEVEMNTKLLFPSGSAVLEPRAMPALSALARVLDTLPNHIQVEGYTDNVPISTSMYPSNWELSAGRAASVVRLFMKDGVDPRHMAAIGYGEYSPIASNDTEAGRSRNRRVVVVILADESARRVLEIERGAGQPNGAGALSPITPPIPSTSLQQPVAPVAPAAGRPGNAASTVGTQP